jgi:2,4-dienoyl-CoA reductase-like NADH-dependent reductase (Old Yellow Enzyme family)
LTPSRNERLLVMPTAWSPLQMRNVLVPNRVWLSPMCQYSAGPSGVLNDWHALHYGSRAIGGVGMVMVECSAIAPDMRTTPDDLGIWNAEQTEAHSGLVASLRALDVVPAIQIGAAGRKSSHSVPWDNSGTRSPVLPEDGGWTPIGPSSLPFAALTTPREMESDDFDRILRDYATATRNADDAGYDVLEIHGANGYLIHEFLSPLANQRTDEYGGSLENRMRFPLAIVETVRNNWPLSQPLLVRLPTGDLIEGGLTTDEAALVAYKMARLGVDMIDASSGVLAPGGPRMSAEPLHTARFGPSLRSAGALVSASGSIFEGSHLDEAVPSLVDAVFVGRALLRDPYWAMRQHGAPMREVWPRQYHRAF